MPRRFRPNQQRRKKAPPKETPPKEPPKPVFIKKKAKKPVYAPTVDISEEQQSTILSIFDGVAVPEGTLINQAHKADLMAFGFDEVEAVHALQQTTSFSDALDYLCIHTPMDNLPESLHGRRVVGLKLYEGGEIPAQERMKAHNDRKIKNLCEQVAQSGWPLSLCHSLVHSALPTPEHLRWTLTRSLREKEEVDDIDNPQWMEEQQDEMVALNAIFGEEQVKEQDGESGVLQVFRPPGYPHAKPWALVVCTAWPSWKLHALHQQINQEAIPSFAEDTPYVWEIVQYVDELKKSSLQRADLDYLNSPLAQEAEERALVEKEKLKKKKHEQPKIIPKKANLLKTLERIESKRKQEEDAEAARAERIRYLKELIDAENCGEPLVKEKFMETPPSPPLPKKEVIWGFDEQKPTLLKEEEPPPPIPVRPWTMEERRQSDALLRQHQQQIQSPKYQKMLQSRMKLPVWVMRNEIVSLCTSHNVVVISGATGSGKTTQVGQFILDEMLQQGIGARANMICTQPRRISATSVAQRVADERGVRCGDEVGYQIRLESKRSSSTRLLFCTSGVLLRVLHTNPMLEGVSMILLDEVHERDLLTDFLLIILKDLVKRRKDLKIVLMSATLNAKKFSSFFGGCPCIDVPGRTFPVQSFFLEDCLAMTGFVCESKGKRRDPKEKDDVLEWEGGRRGGRRQAKQQQFIQEQRDSTSTSKVNRTMSPLAFLDYLWEQGYEEDVLDTLKTLDENTISLDLLQALILHIDRQFEEGAILVFLPGLASIREMHRRLLSVTKSNSTHWQILGLHSTFSHAEQRKVFLHPPKGVRKVVLSTNIAETSVTIDDIVYVVDSGRVNESRYDGVNRTGSLVEDFCSKANALQRAGRAGRCQPGMCFRLYTSLRFAQFLAHQRPEMLRTPLYELALHVKAMGLKEHVANFISRAMDPPPRSTVEDAVAQLQQLQAFQQVASHNVLTPLGRHLACLPLDPRLGKMLIYAAMLGCLDPCLTIAAAITHRSPFVSPFDEREKADKAKRRLSVHNSDHLTTVSVYNQWMIIQRTKGFGAAQAFCRHNYLSVSGLSSILELKNQFFLQLHALGFVEKKRTDRNVDLCWTQMSASFNKNAGNVNLVKAMMVAGLYPHICRVEKVKDVHHFIGLPVRGGGGEVYLHPSSVLFGKEDLGVAKRSFLVYHERILTSKVFVREASVVGPMGLLFFCGESFHLDHGEGVIRVGPLYMRASARVGSMISQLRSKMDILLQDQIEGREVDGEDIKNAVAKLIMDGE